MTRFANTRSFTLALLVTSLRASLVHRRAFALQVVFMALNNVLFFSMWWLVFERFDHIGGWKLHDMLLLYGLVAAAFGVAVVLGGGVRELSRAIRDGELDALLSQPQPALVYALGRRTLISGWGDVASGLVLVALSGHATPARVPLVVLAIAGAACVFLASGIVIHSLTFWLGRFDGLARQLHECVLTFSLYPDPIFGGGLRLVLFTALPAGFIGFVPARLVYAPTASVAVTTVGAACVYTAVAVFVFERGLRRYESGNRIV
jgi:ABC-2 type transport system permease protein